MANYVTLGEIGWWYDLNVSRSLRNTTFSCSSKIQWDKAETTGFILTICGIITMPSSKQQGMIWLEFNLMGNKNSSELMVVGVLMEKQYETHSPVTLEYDQHSIMMGVHTEKVPVWSCTCTRVAWRMRVRTETVTCPGPTRALPAHELCERQYGYRRSWEQGHCMLFGIRLNMQVIWKYHMMPYRTYGYLIYHSIQR